MKNNLAESDAKVGEFMSSNTIKTRIQLKNDTEANWNQAQNFIPKAGEVIIYSGDNSRPFSRLKVGDGRTVVTALPFIHSGVMSINGLEPNISGNFELSAEAIGLNKPLNIIGFLVDPKNPDLTTGVPITDIPRITGLTSYTPKEGDVVLDSRNGVEFACIQIETIETIDEETEEKVEETFYLWKQLGKNAAAVFQKDLTGTLENHNYPITFSPRTDATDTTDKILKDIYFNFNPVNKNLTIGSDSTPGTINGKPIGSAMSKDFIDYNYEVFPNGLNYKGIATNISSGYYNTYTLENEEHSNNAEHGDLVYLNSAAEENSGYYIFHLKDPINTSTWDKIVAKNIGQSDKLITERLLYYYEGNSNISKLGVITQGTWNGNIVDVAHGGTGVNSFINNGILYAGIENNTTVVKSGIMSWGNWVNGTSNGPTITLKIGDVANPLQYTLPAIPIATNDNSGVITTTSQDIRGVKTFTSGAIGLRCINTKLNQILFGTENLSDFDTGDELIGDSEFASINVKMPFNTTQFSFKQFKINNSEENGVITYSKNFSVYEEYLLPEINNDITSTKTYNILTTKSLVTVAEGGTGQSSFDANKILYGNGNGPIQSEIPEWKAWVAGTTAGPQAVFHIGGTDYTSATIPAASTSVSGVVTTGDQSFSGKKTFTGLHLNLTPATGEGGEIHLNASAANTTQAGIVLDQFESKFRIFGIASADGETITGVGTPLVIDPYNKTITGGYTLTGSLTGHASLDLPLTGGIVTGYISLKTNYNASLANNGISSGVGYPTTFNILDSAERIMVRKEAVINSNGSIGSYWYVKNYNTSGTQVAQKGIGMYMAKDGTLTYGVSDPAKFRAAIGTWALVADNNGHDALAKADGTYGWVKIGNPDGSLGLLPGTSGSAGSGHNYIGTSSWYWKYAYIDEIHGSLTGHASLDLPLTGGTMTGDLLFADSGTTTRQIRGIVGANDYWRIAGGATASNAGWMEIATADDGNEPIYVRQYTGAYTTIKRTLTLLDANGYMLLPSYINVPTSNSENPTVSQIIVTNGDDSYYRKASTAHVMAAIRSAASGSWGINVTGSSASCTGNAATATKLSNTPNNTTTFLRGDNSWSNTLTGNLTVTNGGIFRVDHTGQGAKTKGTAYGAFYLAFKNSANSATYTTEPIRYVGTDATDTYNTCVILGSNNGTTWVGAGESSSYMPGKVAYNDENLYLSADGSVKIYTSCTNDGSSYSGPVTISGTTITANLTGNVTGNCSGSSGSCTGNAATATRVISPDASVSYVEGSKGTSAAVYAKKTYNVAHWYPAVALETYGGGAWQIGNYNNENLNFAYVTKANRDAGNNTVSVFSINSSGNFNGTAANVTGTVAIEHGGTGATSASAARTNLGLGGMAVKAALKSFTMTTNKTSNANGNITLRLDNTTNSPVYLDSTKYIVVAAICESSTNRILIPWVYYPDKRWDVQVINPAGGTAFNAVINTALPGNLTFWYYTI